MKGWVAVTLMVACLQVSNVYAHEEKPMTIQSSPADDAALTSRQQSIIPISAFAASGDIGRLGPALDAGLDAGLNVSEAREILVQVYAYAGFPRSLNALGELMKVMQARRERGVFDEPGREPSKPIPTGEALLAAGTANQTRLVGGPVAGPLFDFAPQANVYLRNHLFGDIFERDNLDWHTRELATVSMLSALTGVESQLQSHMGISLNIGLDADALGALVAVLEQQVGAQAAQRADAALQRTLESRRTK